MNDVIADDKLPAERRLTVPAAWPEPEWAPSTERLATALGTAVVVVEGSEVRESHPRITLRCDWSDINGVLYTWSASFAHSGDGYQEAGRQLERKGDARWDKLPANGALRRFNALVSTLAPEVSAWVEDHQELIAARRLESLRSSAHYLSLDAHRDAERLVEKLAQLEGLAHEISVLEGTLAVNPGERSRLSPLASAG